MSVFSRLRARQRDPTTAAAFFDDSRLVRLSGDSSRIHWRHVSGQAGESGLPCCVNFSGRSRHLLCGDDIGTLSVFPTPLQDEGLHPSRSVRGPDSVLDLQLGCAVFDAKWSPSGSLIGVASGKQRAFLLDVETRETVHTLLGHRGSVKKICFLPGSDDCLVTCSRDGSIRLWDMRQGQDAIRCLEGFHWPRMGGLPKRSGQLHSVTDVEILQDGLTMCSCGASDGNLLFWDIRNLRDTWLYNSSHLVDAFCASSPSSARPRNQGFSSLRATSSGTRLLAACRDNSLYLFDWMAPSTAPAVFRGGHTMRGFFIRSDICPNDRWIACGSHDGAAYLYDAMHPEEEPLLLENNSGSEISSVAWDPFMLHHRPRLAFCSDDSTCSVVTMETVPRLQSRNGDSADGDSAGLVVEEVVLEEVQEQQEEEEEEEEEGAGEAHGPHPTPREVPHNWLRVGPRNLGARRMLPFSVSELQMMEEASSEEDGHSMPHRSLFSAAFSASSSSSSSSSSTSTTSPASPPGSSSSFTVLVQHVGVTQRGQRLVKKRSHALSQDHLPSTTWKSQHRNSRRSSGSGAGSISSSSSSASSRRGGIASTPTPMEVGVNHRGFLPSPGPAVSSGAHFLKAWASGASRVLPALSPSSPAARPQHQGEEQRPLAPRTSPPRKRRNLRDFFPQRSPSA